MARLAAAVWGLEGPGSASFAISAGVGFPHPDPPARETSFFRLLAPSGILS